MDIIFILQFMQRYKMTIQGNGKEESLIYNNHILHIYKKKKKKKNRNIVVGTVLAVNLFFRNYKSEER